MSAEPWYPFCLREIDYAIQTGKKRLSDWEKDFLETVRPRIERGISLTEKQEDALRKLHERATELRRIKY